MFAIEDFLRVSNQMRDYYAKKICEYPSDNP